MPCLRKAPIQVLRSRICSWGVPWPAIPLCAEMTLLDIICLMRDAYDSIIYFVNEHGHHARLGFIKSTWTKTKRHNHEEITPEYALGRTSISTSQREIWGHLGTSKYFRAEGGLRRTKFYSEFRSGVGASTPAAHKSSLTPLTVYFQTSH